ncbi:ATP-binding protein [Chondromyces apiculatus]|uniref:Putative ATPase (AAA+ superfamily) n=1 Tax=Chondromyces apiculatus DSM 436 TaxID=1192034 RepID=A0A017T781_9BACT|nr:ATP-binding protein [Chondromyces apiculatus]EYF04451.1 putative ATPase (AAA+ superfamily) [Chondromyces apiculatus DSM 436]
MSDVLRFELDCELPDPGIRERTERLIGFEPRFERAQRDLLMLLAPDEIRRWSKRKHHRELPVCGILADRYPLMIFHGDVGTGKTATAEGIANRISGAIEQNARLMKLSTRVRGRGLHGEMSKLVGEAFDAVRAAAGNKGRVFLVIDEADALAASREGAQLHQEERAGTNTLIQKIDEMRALKGRVLVILCTNRLHALDPAIVRRAARIEEFTRPTEDERRELLRRDLDGLELTERDLERLVAATGPDPKTGRPGMTFSDIRTRFLPAAVSEVFPEHPLSCDVLLRVAKATMPSPAIV